MADLDSNLRSLVPDSLPPQYEENLPFASEHGALQDQVTMFMAAIVQLEATFCNNLWPAFSSSAPETQI
jgi:hypothetical protein